MLGEPVSPSRAGPGCPAHSLCTLSPSLYYPAVRTTAATASRLAAALPLAAERCLASLLTRRPAALSTAYGVWTLS